MEKIKVTRPVASVRGFGKEELAVSEIANVRKSNSGKSLLFDRIGQKDFSNGKIELSYASMDQEAALHNWFVDENGKPVAEGKESFINPPKMFGLKEGRGIYA
jgi:hypothetical protein